MRARKEAAPGPARVRRPVRRGALVVALAGALALLCCGGSVSAFFLGNLGGDEDSLLLSAFGCGERGPVDPNSDLPKLGTLGEAQMRNAAIIINVGADMKVPPRGWVIAIATALQESVLTNLPHLGRRNDHDSVGLFQQRPSQGWGTPKQLQDPEYASRKFYGRLLTVKGWQGMALTVAAQRVQRSAFPDAYAKHERLATDIVNTLADGAARSSGSEADLRCTAPGEIAASGWTAPVLAPIVSAFRTASRPSHHGVDLGARRHTKIRSAAAGVVTHIECDTDSRPPYSCNHDGSPSTPGCGWYAEVTHAKNIVTRYCHMQTRPFVREGQTVGAGDVIGEVGTSGNSSGPHLHFEIHLDGDRSSRGAVDPATFMKDQGAPLGMDT